MIWIHDNQETIFGVVVIGLIVALLILASIRSNRERPR